MAIYKFTRIYKAEAATKADALEKIKQNPTEYLEYEAATLVQTDKGGWSSTFKKQVTGK
jgi:hypothetical protein